MDLTTITMDPDEALERAAAYEDLKAPTDEERAIWEGFVALAAGKQLINLPEAIRAGGHDEHGWPRLAVMGAQVPWCHLSVRAGRDGEVRWTFTPPPPQRGKPSQRHRYEIRTTIHDVEVSHLGQWSRWRALVPNVPPELRPRGKGTWAKVPISLAHFSILWEVPEWEQAPRPPGDPALLRHLGGDLWTVEAVWDLTPLEQAVLSGRKP